MRFFLAIFGAIVWLLAIVAVFIAPTPILELAGIVLFVGGSVLIGSACIVSAVENAASARQNRE